jgi:8-oxo-dGTP pyrophosphatase MutT (NUDIX family)
MRPNSVAASDMTIVPIERIDVAYVSRPWPFAQARRAEIDAHFAALKRQRPGLWNGKVLLLREFSIAGRVFRGACSEVDYASFMAWQEWGFPDRDSYDCFSMGTIRTSDGAFLLGVMAPHTFNAGQVYFPCGTPDHNDIVADGVDFEGSIRREVSEETGLDVAEFEAEQGWHTVFGGATIAHMKLLHARQTAAELRERILANLAREREPELSDIRIVRSPADFDAMMPAFVPAFLRHIWSRT